MLLCPVRDCHKPLQLVDRTRQCERKHSFDLARSGYTNLLQPQDRRSKQPGDTAGAVAARRRLHDLGVTRPLLEALLGMLQLRADDVVLDAGCGDGFYLGSFVQQTGCGGHGVDISIAAVEAAARRYSGCEWIVANADRFLPYKTGGFPVAVSITGRMPVDELRRVLRDEGRLLIAVAAPDDLIELRGHARDRVERTVESFHGQFRLEQHSRATTTVELQPESVQDVLLSIYRPRPTPPQGPMRVTFSLDLLLFTPS